MDRLLTVRDVAELAGYPVATIRQYVWRRRHDRTGHGGIPPPDSKLADRPAWNETTIRPWLDERRAP